MKPFMLTPSRRLKGLPSSSPGPDCKPVQGTVNVISKAGISGLAGGNKANHKLAYTK